jgi:predicted NAD/FAD-binding protein
MIHGRLWLSGSGLYERASTGTRWWVIGSTADWLVPNNAASARVVRLVRRWMRTSSTLTVSGRPHGRPVAGGSRWRARTYTVWTWLAVSPVSGTRFR